MTKSHEQEHGELPAAQRERNGKQDAALGQRLQEAVVRKGDFAVAGFGAGQAVRMRP